MDLHAIMSIALGGKHHLAQLLAVNFVNIAKNTDLRSLVILLPPFYRHL